MVTRTQLYESVWTEPAQVVAKRFDVSGSYLARVCERLRVPTPARGYWAKIAAGKIMARPNLPDPRPGDEISWDPGGGTAEIFEVSTLNGITDSLVVSVQKTRTKIVGDTHQLLVNVTPLYLSGGLSYQKKFLKPTKRLLPDIHSSKEGLDKIVEFANAFFNVLESQGFRVGFEPIGLRMQRPTLDVREKFDQSASHDNFWSPARNTVIFMRDLRVGLTIFELTESIPMRHVNGKYVKEAEYFPSAKMREGYSWVSNQDVPCGKIGVQIYISQYDQRWNKVWREKSSGQFSRKIMSLVRELASQYDEIASEVKAGKEKAEVQRIKDEESNRLWEIRREQELLSKSIQDSRDSLIAMRNKFEESERWNRFFAHIMEMGKNLSLEDSNKLARQIEEMRLLVSRMPNATDYLNWLPPKKSPYISILKSKND